MISSDAVGSGIDRVQSGINGYLFSAGNVKMLGDLLLKVVKDDLLRLSIAETAISSSKTILPKDNAEVLISLF